MSKLKYVRLYARTCPSETGLDGARCRFRRVIKLRRGLSYHHRHPVRDILLSANAQRPFVKSKSPRLRFWSSSNGQYWLLDTCPAPAGLARARHAFQRRAERTRQLIISVGNPNLPSCFLIGYHLDAMRPSPCPADLVFSNRGDRIMS